MKIDSYQSGYGAGQKAVQVVKRFWWILVLLLLMLLATGWWWQQRQANQPTITTVTPQVQDLTRSLDVSGEIEARRQARLRFIAGGKITQVNAQTGDRVTQHQTMAVIDQATLQKQLERDLNAFQLERWNWDNLQDQYDYHVETEQIREQLDRAQIALDNEVLDVEIRDIAIRNNVLMAPFSGVVTQAPDLVTGSTILSTDFFEIVDPSSLVLKADVDEAEIALIKQNQVAVITLDAFPDREFTSYVDFISYTSKESTSGTVFEVELPIDVYAQGLENLRLGMNGDVAITLEQKSEVLAVPLATIRQRDGVYFVDVLENEQITERQIEIGLETDEYVEVVSGLSVTDQVVVPSSL